MFEGFTEAEARIEIEEQLKRHRAKQMYEDKVKELRDHAAINVFVSRPNLAVPDNVLRAANSKGEGPIRIIEFSDFQCPFCRSFQTVLARIMQKYSGQVRLTFLHYPLTELHSHAYSAATASECAAKQDSFWVFSDQIWKLPVLTNAALLASAARFVPDKEAFEKCMSGQESREIVDGDIALAKQLGISGTPTVIVNGSVLTGVPSFEELDNLVARQLLNRQAGQ